MDMKKQLKHDVMPTHIHSPSKLRTHNLTVRVVWNSIRALQS